MSISIFGLECRIPLTAIANPRRIGGNPLRPGNITLLDLGAAIAVGVVLAAIILWLPLAY